eukprot:876098-Lingulodinium_polyedra.AAC.1
MQWTAGSGSTDRTMSPCRRNRPPTRPTAAAPPPWPTRATRAEGPRRGKPAPGRSPLVAGGP